jgi:glycine betaine/proline transport system substrate-binding protein
MKLATATALLAALGSAAPALAADPEACQTIRMSDPGWTDITTTNALAGVVLSALGYEQEVDTLSVPVGFEGLKSGDVDVFLGNWMPSHAAFREELDAAGAVEVLAKNLTGAKFTLAVPAYVAEAGVSDLADLDPNAEKFDSTIYGIEPGAVANINIQKMIDADEFGLGDWTLVDSGEQAMLAQVRRAAGSEDWIVFLAWAPHPMNVEFDIAYLAGGDAYFGPNYGGAEVFTLARAGWPAECPNAAQLFRNLVFSIEMENEMMGLILDGEAPDDAAEAWLKDHPEVLGPWLEGVTTFEGEPGLPAVQAALGL